MLVAMLVPMTMLVLMTVPVIADARFDRGSACSQHRSADRPVPGRDEVRVQRD